ncbi:pilus assembly protein [Paenibacillus filicis]|uniref:Pilus assembly protein n=1 Tax=Paenibacillus gyeongsangnamensis TaxID=3388067 RepID=A0ABT4QG89_9BACL|nr:TadE family protein [Paenibacillus filicis]MCZ8515876.1 pilus assembly protein [Paenibacillus filicis]
MRSVWKQDQGGVVLEAALVLPFFVAFVALMIVLVRLSIAEMALQSAVSESAKVIAANMYPVELLAGEARSKWNASRPSVWLDEAVSRVENIRQRAVDAESFVEEYEHWIPDPLVRLLAWEKSKREQAESWGAGMTEEAKERAMTEITEAATPIVAFFADKRRINTSKLKVTKITFPNFDHKEEAFVGVEAQLQFTFAVPFFRKDVLLKKKALERAWVGGSGI